MGCHLSVRISPELKEFVRKHSPTMRSPVRLRRRNAASPRMRGTQGRPRFDSHFSTEKIALVIAINVYEHGWGNLDTCETDGKRIADYFKSNDFQVKTLFGKDATRENIMRNIQKIDVCKTAVIYFAGHGISGKFGPALVPVDAQHNSHDIVDKISQDSIQSFSRRTRAHGVVFILDCCFGGDFCVKLRGTERPSFCLNQMEKSRIVLSASMKGERVPDAENDSASSPFTKSLLDSMHDECFSGSVIELFVTTRARAIAIDAGIVPKLGRLRGDEGGDVFL